jgi:hypothetical protein
MKIKNYLPRTQEHKAFLSNFLAPLTAFIIVFGAIIYHFN